MVYWVEYDYILYNIIKIILYLKEIAFKTYVLWREQPIQTSLFSAQSPEMTQPSSVYRKVTMSLDSRVGNLRHFLWDSIKKENIVSFVDTIWVSASEGRMPVGQRCQLRKWDGKTLLKNNFPKVLFNCLRRLQSCSVWFWIGISCFLFLLDWSKAQNASHLLPLCLTCVFTPAKVSFYVYFKQIADHPG